MNIHQRALSLLLSLALVCGIFSLDTTVAWAAGSTLTIDSSWSNTDISGHDTVQLPNTSPTTHTVLTADGQDVTIVGQSTVTYPYLTIMIKDSAKVTIRDLSINNTDDYPAVDVQSDDDGNTLYLDSGSCTLQGGKFQPGIRVEGSNEITIDKAPTATDGTAVLNVSSSWYAAVIGGRGSRDGSGTDGGTVNIKGGTIHATGNNNGAGIGGGYGGGYGGNGGKVTISGGTITATGNNGGAGIGGGGTARGTAGGGGTVDITGGAVTAYGSDIGGAGIGGGGPARGTAGSGGTVDITGGTVMAYGGEYGGAGIGGGGFSNLTGYNYNGGAGGMVDITGGTVYAYGGKGGGVKDASNYCKCGGGAGIGGGGGYTGGAAGDIQVSGGNVTTISNYYGSNTDIPITHTGGAGIGGGGSYQNTSSSCGTVTISGGARVTASATTLGAGIGAGVGSSGASDGGGTVNITGGTVTATGAGTGCADIGGSATANHFDGGSIDADAGKVAAAPALTSGTAVYKAMLQLADISTATLVSCTANGSTFDSYTDANRKLYIWLPSGSPKTVVSNAGNIGTYSGTVTSGGTNILSLLSTACDVTGVTSPSGAMINGTDISAQVGNGITSATVDVTVSPNATWKLYSDQSCQTEIANKVVSLNVGINTAFIKVTAQDGTTEKIYTLAVTRAGSPDANLAGLSVKAGSSGVPLSPAFDTDTLNYTANVGSNISEVTVTPVVRESNAAYTVNGSSPAAGQTGVDVALNGTGTTTPISVEVTAQSGGKQTYRIAVVRAGSSACDITGVTNPSGATISGTDITASVGSGTASVTVDVTVSSGATWKLYHDQNCQTEFSNKIMSLNVGVNTAYIKVTAQDSSTAKTYTLKITRAASNSSGGSSGGSFAPSLPSSLTDAPTNTTVDLSGATFPAWVTGVSLSSSPLSSGGVSDQIGNTVYHLAISQTELNVIGSPFVYNIQLLDQNGNPVSFTGSVTVRIPLPAGLRGTPHVFRYEESTGTLTDLGATVENDFLVFQTTHFSYYVIAGTGDSITLDTKSYQMPIGGKYQIGVKLTGSKALTVKFHSTNDKIAAVAKLKNGNYQVTGKGTGTVWIMFDVYDNKNRLLSHASTRVDVKTGIRPRGDSTRQIGVF